MENEYAFQEYHIWRIDLSKILRKGAFKEIYRRQH